jgi:hypothetical protein
MTNIIDETNTESTDSRRSLLRRAAVGSAGAAVAVLALDRTASAADGDNLVLGDENLTAESPTVVDVTPAGAPTGEGPSALSVGGYAPSASSPFAAAVGGYGDTTILHGVHGSTTAPGGLGVVAANLSPVLPAAATDAAPAALAVASIAGPQIKFVTLDGAVAGPTTGEHSPGELYVDADGTLWFTVPVPPVPPATDPGVRFVKLAATATAGALHTLPFPVRVFDSRKATFPVQKPAANSVTEVGLTTKQIDGSPSGFPAGATAALINLTIANSENKGFFSVAAAGVDTPPAEVFSNGNWTQAGTNLGTSVTTAVGSDGKITITLGPEGGTHLIVDVVGYYL